MKLFLEGRFVTLAGVLLVSLAATSAPMKLLYQDTLTTPNGTQQNVTAMITIAARQADGTHVTIAATGQPPVTVTISPGGTLPAPQGTPSPQRAQGTLILQRVMLLGQIRRSMPATSVDVRIPVLAPGASEPLALPAKLTQSAVGGKQALTGSASTSTTATIDPQKAKIHGILPARRLAERAKNALTPSHVTLPDQVTASVRASLTGGAVTKLSGNVAHALNAHGQTTTLNENWSLKPAL